MNPWFEWRNAPQARYAVIGDPIEHSLSPKMHQAWLDSLGIDAKYVAIKVPLEEFYIAVEQLAALGYVGINVTIPNKIAAFNWASSMDENSRRIGALNTLNLESGEGTNTDAPGFLATLKTANFSLPANCLVLGAGGAARAVVAALAESSCRISIWNRTAERAQKLIEELAVDATVVEIPNVSGYGLIVNCTSGVSQADLNLRWNEADANCLAYDLMIGTETPFLAGARATGLRTKDGVEMLIEQGALSMEFWSGKTVDRAIYRNSLSGGDS